MGVRQPYKGYVLEADPARRCGGIIARVVIELHTHGAVHFQEVFDDPFVRYGTWGEAEQASLQFGKTLIDSRPCATDEHPAVADSH